MTAPASPRELAWPDVRDYLVARGFRLLPTGWTDAGVFKKDNLEVLLPFESTFSDYPEALQRAVQKIADFEGRAPADVIADLTTPRSDRVRFAQRGDATADGKIGGDFARELVEGARRSLLSAAHSEERPDLRYHKRLSQSVPGALVRACRLGPAEQRSFAFSIHCPHDLPDELPGSGFGRRTVARLMRTVGRAVDTIVRVGPQPLLDASEPVITSNLCEALLQMMPRDEKTDLELDVRFSPLLPAPAESPQHVRVERSLYGAFEDLARSLRPPSTPVDDVYVGRVLELSGDVNDAGALEGDVVLLCAVDEELLRVRCTLGPDDYLKALDAHRRQRHVSVHGRLVRSGRRQALVEPKDVRIIE